jgi:AcrR family transcriptional regulator
MTKGEDTRAAILDQALAIASEVGFTGLTIGQLAEQTQMSKSGLFAHFRSKETLQLETLEWARERFTDLVIRPTLAVPRGEQRVRALFDHWLDWETDALRGGCIFVTATTEFDDQPGAMRDALVRNQRDWMEFVATVVGTAVSEGDFREDLDAGQLAFTLQGLMLGYHHAARLLQDPRALDRTRRALDQLLEASAAPDRAGSAVAL